MKVHNPRDDFRLLSEAYAHVINNIPEPDPRASLARGIAQGGNQARFLNLKLRKCERKSNNIKVFDSVQVDKPLYHTLSTESRQLSPGREFQNPYQAKINYFQSAMRNSKIDSALASKKDNKKRADEKFTNTCPIQGNNGNQSSPRVDNVSRPHSPTSSTNNNYKIALNMTSSQSVKNQVSLKNELSKNDSTRVLEEQIHQLNQRVRKLEKENKKLKHENKEIK